MVTQDQGEEGSEGGEWYGVEEGQRRTERKAGCFDCGEGVPVNKPNATLSQAVGASTF